MHTHELGRQPGEVESGGEQHSVLVVNDSPDQLTFTMELLRDAGYRVVGAADGLAGVDAAVRSRPDLIISDVVMPRADGLELCRRVRAHPDLQSTPVLLMSGLATDSESAVAGMRAGADDYLEIPFDPMRLVSKVARLIERARTEGRLRAEREMLREAQRLAQVGSWSWMREGNRTSWSEELYRIAGLDPASPAPPWAEQSRLYGENADRLFRVVDRATKTGEPFEVEVEMIRPDGDRRWVIARGEPMRGEGGSVIGLRGTIQDTTERQHQRQMLERANQSLERSERRYRDLVENLNDVVFSFDAAGLFRYVSPSVQKYGYFPDELLGKHFSLMIHPDDLSVTTTALEESMRCVVESLEFRLLDRVGAVHRVHVSSRPVFDEGRFTGVAGVVIDVTGQRNAEEQLRAAQRLEAVGRLAGGIAHDFNNLLVAIIGYAEFAVDGVPEDAPLRRDIEEILKAGHRAAALTRQLLAFSRKQVLSPKVISLNEVITGMVGMLRRLIGEDVDFQIALEPELGAVLADPGQMEQVIMNLVVNARDAMPTGGRIRVETSSRTETSAEGTPEPRIVVAVSDTGSGMDEKTKAQIWEPFFTTKRPGEGTGLGLPTVHGIVNQSGGTIDVITAPGQGTTFVLAFPRAEQLPRTTEPATSAQATSGQETILIVEDEPAVRALARRFLSAAGYQVLTAESGAAALEICESHRGEIDLLLTDVVMPQMSGRALWDRLSALRPGLRVLFMSGYSGTHITRHGVLEEGTYLIHKPFNAAELSRRVREVLHGRTDEEDGRH